MSVDTGSSGEADPTGPATVAESGTAPGGARSPGGTSAPAGTAAPAGTSAKPAAGDSDKLDAGVLKVAGVVVIGAIMSILDITVVNVGLPTFQKEFNTAFENVAWTMTAYTLALATVIPVTGWAADRFGTKRLYLTSLVFFVAGSALCSMAWDIGPLIAFRVVQGIGGGMLMPLGMTIMTRAAGPERVGRVMAVLGVPMLLGPIAGPILGGWLIESYSWHWIFLINLPIGLAGLIFATIVLPKDRPHPSEAFDVLGLVLLSPGLASFLYGVSSIPEAGKVGDPEVLIPAGIGLALIVAFVFHALRKDHPLIDLHLFRNRNLTVSVVTMSFFVVAFMGSMLLLPTYFIQVRGEGTLDTGLLLAPQGLGAMLTMPIAGRLTDRTGPGKLVLTGIVLILAGLSTYTQVADDTPYGLLLGALFVMGLGMGCTMMPIMSGALATLTDHEIARGSTLMNIVQQTGGSIGTATMSVVLANQMLDKPAVQAANAVRAGVAKPEQFPQGLLDQAMAQAADAFGSTYVVAVSLIVLCVVPAFFLPRRKLKRSPEQQAEAPVPVALH